MNLLQFNIKIFVIIIVSFCLIRFGYSDDGDGYKAYKNQLSVEMELLKNLESRLNMLSRPGTDKTNAGKVPLLLKGAGRDGADEQKNIEVFSQTEGLRIIKRLYGYGIYLYSVTADNAPLEEVLKQLVNSNNLEIFLERIEPVVLRKRINVSLENMPFHDVLEIVTGMFGLEFVLNDENRSAIITIPSNLGIANPLEYFRGKIVNTFRKVQIKYPDNELVPDSHFKLGEFFYSMGLTILASQEFMVIAERYPSHVLAKKALVNMAKCYEDVKDFKRARDIYNEFVERYPRDDSLSNIYYAITETLYKEGKYENAIKIYKKILQMYPSTDLTGEIRDHIVTAYYKNKDYSNAFDELIALKKNKTLNIWSVDKDFMVGECLYQMEKYEDAFIVFSNISENDELDSDKVKKAAMMMAQSLHKSDHCIEAIQTFKRWMETYGDDAYSMLSIGKCYRSLNLNRLAIDILVNALSLYSESGYGNEIKFELAMAYSGSELYDNAITLFSEIEKNEDSPLFIDSVFNKAETLFTEKSYKNASASYEKVLPLIDKDKDRAKYVEKRLAACYLNMGLYTKALNAYQNE